MTAVLDTPVTEPTAVKPPLTLVPSDPPIADHLTREQVEELGEKLLAIYERERADLGQRDADYIHKVIRAQRGLEVAGRAMLFAGVLPPAWLAGTAMLSAAKILENMEIGHNVLHGQWDWMRDPEIHSSTWEWDTMSTSESWKHSHNYMHHTFTNVVGKDRDVGYGILRLSEEQRWTPYYLLNPVLNIGLSLLFQYGVALHDLEVEKVRAGKKPVKKMLRELKGMGKKIGRQLTKDYVVFPALAGPFFAPVIAGNLTANLVRNVWSHAIIFCGHFPDGAAQFDLSQLEDETKGQWYVRQMMGSANIEGGPLLDLMSGNLSYQIEHHLFPDLPSNRYKEIAPEVQALCEEYGIPYTTGPLWKQYLQVINKINRLALP